MPDRKLAFVNGPVDRKTVSPDHLGGGAHHRHGFRPSGEVTAHVTENGRSCRTAAPSYWNASLRRIRRSPDHLPRGGPESSGSGTLSGPRQLSVQASRYSLPQRGLIGRGCDGMPSSGRRPEFLFRSTGSKTELVSELVCAAFRCDIPRLFPLFRLVPKSAEHAKWLYLL
jgi:hypothetical protein